MKRAFMSITLLVLSLSTVMVTSSQENVYLYTLLKKKER